MKYNSGDLSQLSPLADPVALTLGNFDGVHCGHQFLIRNLLQQAKKRSLQSCVLCFSPHPARVLGDKIFEPLMELEDKKTAIENLGVDHLVVQNFTEAFAKVPAEDFLRQYLGRFFNIQYLSVGYDFRFGKGGLGNFQMISDFFKEKNIEVYKEVPFEMNSDTPSSTKIREALKCGDVSLAKKFLGRNYSLKGQVVQGEAKGRTIGFPTANLAEVKSLVPGRGVYVVQARIKERWLRAVCNIGVRPTLDGKKQSIEVHIMNFNQDLYGQVIEIQFLFRIRGEKKFENFDKLKEQIEKDVQFARAFKG